MAGLQQDHPGGHQWLLILLALRFLLPTGKNFLVSLSFWKEESGAQDPTSFSLGLNCQPCWMFISSQCYYLPVTSPWSQTSTGARTSGPFISSLIYLLVSWSLFFTYELHENGILVLLPVNLQ